MRLAPECDQALSDTADRLRLLGHTVGEAEPSYGFLSPAFVPRYLRSARDSAVRLVDPKLLSPAAKVPARLGQFVSLDAVAASRHRGEQWSAIVTEEIFGCGRCPACHRSCPRPLIRPSRFHAGRPLRAAWRSSQRTAYTTAWNVAGFPAASVPAGFTETGLPLAVQLVALPGRERTLIALAAELQRSADWTERRPSV